MTQGQKRMAAQNHSGFCGIWVLAVLELFFGRAEFSQEISSLKQFILLLLLIG